MATGQPIACIMPRAGMATLLLNEDGEMVSRTDAGKRILGIQPAFISRVSNAQALRRDIPRFAHFQIMGIFGAAPSQWLFLVPLKGGR